MSHVRDLVGEEFGFDQDTTGTWWGDCVRCGHPKASVGNGGYSCSSCAWSLELEELAWLDEPDVPGTFEPDALPMDVLPEVLRAAAATLAASTQAPIDSAIGAVIGGVSVAIVGRAKVEIRPDTGWVKPAHTYVGIEQPSGTGKSPLINAVLKPIADWERRRGETDRLVRMWADERVQLATSRVQAARKMAVKGQNGESALEAALAALAEAEDQPRGPFQFLVADATEEEMIRVLADNWGRAASVDPEGTLLEVVGGRYGNGDARLAALTHGWDGEPMRVNRVSRARVNLPATNLALLIGVQPGVLAGLANADTMRQRGVLARFLWIAPRICWDDVLVGPAVPPLDRAAMARYGKALTRILDSSDKSEACRVLRMSPEAQEGVYRLEQAKLDGLRPGGPLESVPSFAGKLPDHGSRLAALLFVADRADRGDDLYSEPIPGWAMEAARQLIAAISTHVVKVTGDAGADPELLDLRYLLDRAIEGAGLTESKIRERARARQALRNAKYARKLFDILEERGCIRRLVRLRNPGPGRDPSPLIRVHPALRASD